MRTHDVVARILALGSLLLAVLTVSATAHAAASADLVIAQGPGDLKPCPVDVPLGEEPSERGDEDTESDDDSDSRVHEGNRWALGQGPGTAALFGDRHDGERSAKARALERPPRHAPR